MGWLEHGGSSTPTQRDRRLVTRMRRMVVDWFELPQNAERRADQALLNGTWAAFRARTLRDPAFNASGQWVRQGGWGGTAAFLAIASRWGIDIVCWDARHRHTQSHVRVVRPEGVRWVPLDVVRVGDCCGDRCSTNLCGKHLYRLVERGRRGKLVHVLYNGTDHYAAVVEPAPWHRRPRGPHWTIADPSMDE